MEGFDFGISAVIQDPLSDTIQALEVCVPPKKKNYVRRVARACLECHRSHLSCEAKRPCQRCVEKGRICISEEQPKKQDRSKKRRSSSENHGILEGLQHIHQTNPTLFEQMLSQDSSMGNVMGILRDNSVLDLPDNTIGLFSEVFTMPVMECLRPANITPEEWLAKHLEKMIRRVAVLEERVPGLAEKLRPIARISAEQLMQQQRNGSKHRTADLIAKIAIELEKSIESYKDLTSPVMIWNRGHTVVWVNDAFRHLTGLTTPLPDEEEDFSLLDVFSNDGIEQFFASTFRAALTYFKTLQIVPELYKCGIQNYRDEGPDYIEGILSITEKGSLMDSGMHPLLCVGIFLPTDVQEYRYNQSEWDEYEQALTAFCQTSLNSPDDYSALVSSPH
eukprot:TRINITY_DN1843_c1_g1_i1.p1 TRINITY_DN1843_c1_g1~~TRINITY_DN1843_c1_g1_i1.p1  ORF type:complete len:391 (-),score=67.11 TRINITY_DN1843_c1_g1_i1:126-1298(-)